MLDEVELFINDLSSDSTVKMYLLELDDQQTDTKIDDD